LLLHVVPCCEREKAAAAMENHDTLWSVGDSEFDTHPSDVSLAKELKDKLGLYPI